MSLATAFSRAVHRQLRVYAAWLPVANTFAVGDFGLVQWGVFHKIGNVSAFGAAFTTRPGPSAPIDFVSQGVRIVKMVGGVAVDSLGPAGDVEAKLKIDFQNMNSCVIRGTLTPEEMQDAWSVAQKLAGSPGWERRFRVVSAIYIGKGCLILASQQAGTSVEITAKASLLQEVEKGNIDFEPSVTASSDKMFKSVGKSGVVGLKLFRLGRVGATVLTRLAAEKGDVEDDWGEDLEDDL